uniref:B box-type domain-containing protein n=1 Tax=Scleropages formosus TaxID=113540 RepID=A0A8C9R1E3_SCLFO
MMELKDLFVLHKASPVKLKPRSVEELRVETAQLQQEHQDMEQRLQELRAAMSREKEERKKLGAFRWKSAHAGSVTGASRRHADSKENNSHKLPSGRVRVRLLKQEPPEELRRAVTKPPRPPLVPGNVASDRKSRLRGKPCGQCETRAAGLMCAECGEDYCVGCFARFHQKGALKHHRMIPMKMEIHTSISTLDVLGRFRRQIDADETSAPLWEGGMARSAAPSEAPVRIQSAEVSTQEGEEDVQQEERGHLGGQRATLLSGDFDEEESARTFQEALERWRQGGKWPHGPEEVLPASRECVATQADLTLRRLVVQVEFQEHGLSYMERLLIKKHRRWLGVPNQPLPLQLSGELKAKMHMKLRSWMLLLRSLWTPEILQIQVRPE